MTILYKLMPKLCYTSVSVTVFTTDKSWEQDSSLGSIKKGAIPKSWRYGVKFCITIFWNLYFLVFLN